MKFKIGDKVVLVRIKPDNLYDSSEYPRRVGEKLTISEINEPDIYCKKWTIFFDYNPDISYLSPEDQERWGAYEDEIELQSDYELIINPDEEKIIEFYKD